MKSILKSNGFPMFSPHLLPFQQPRCGHGPCATAATPRRTRGCAAARSGWRRNCGRASGGIARTWWKTRGVGNFNGGFYGIL